jgi:hypothetical protein
MDITSAALTNAWLQAVSRIQSQQTPGPPVPREERTMTDVIEGVLRSGGLDSQDPQWEDPSHPGHVVDRTV